MSFGSSNYDSEIATFIADHPEIYFLASVGDRSEQEFMFPSSLDDCISVCAIDEKGNQYDYSNTSSKWSISAPGVSLDIPSVNYLNDVVTTVVSGSSYATAIVSGIIASCLLSNNLNRSNLLSNQLYQGSYLNCEQFLDRNE